MPLLHRRRPDPLRHPGADHARDGQGRAGALSLEPARIAVIVPTLNEAHRIGPLLDGLRRFAEVVVADGGGDDGTAAIAATRPGVRVIAAPRGRGPQMNAGARTCRSEVLLFLHADTELPPDAPCLIREALRDPSTAAGAFRVRFDGGGPLMRLAAWFTRFDTGLTTFGDQAFFMRRTVFEAADGFPDRPFLEDVEMRRRLRRLGRFVKLRAAVCTSARRFEADGAWRRFGLNACILLLHRLGVGPERLLRWYAPADRSQGRSAVPSVKRVGGVGLGRRGPSAALKDFS